MLKAFWVSVLLCVSSAPALATTAPDLSARIRVDGFTSDFALDEWVVDAETVVSEMVGDSRWGRFEDVRRLAITWDLERVYVAVDCAIGIAGIVVLLDYRAGGAASLVDVGLDDGGGLNVTFPVFRPDAAFFVGPERGEGRGVIFEGKGAPARLPDGLYRARLAQGGQGTGFEVAVPWTVLDGGDGTVAVAALVSGGVGRGAGDVIPDGDAPPPNDPDALVRLNNAAIIPYDADADGVPDSAVSPRAKAAFPATSRPIPIDVSSIDVATDARSFHPDQGGRLRIRVSPAAARSAGSWFVTIEVYASDGRRVAVILRDEKRSLGQPGLAPWNEWDGRDDSGRIVPGGIYLVLASGGGSPSERRWVSKKAVAVIR